MSQKPTCLCNTEMELLMKDKRAEIWECPKDARLLYRSKVTTVQLWYLQEKPLGLEKDEMTDFQCQSYLVGSAFPGKPVEGQKIKIPTTQLQDVYKRWKGLEPSGDEEVDRVREYYIGLLRKELQGRGALEQ
ncbi:hypothetical protein ES703_18424 [subsurface metagenome]